jgi:hypothetical protein
MLKNETSYNPKGPSKSFDSNEPYAEKRVSRGGSFYVIKAIAVAIETPCE